MRKKKIAINIVGGDNWVGGLYYRMNILFSLIQNRQITEKYQFVVITSKNNYEMIRQYFPSIDIIEVNNSTVLGKINFLLKLVINRCSMLYVSDKKMLGIFGITAIEWIPDFQHIYYQDFFKKDEIEYRNTEFKKKARSSVPLILSSQEAFNDFKKYYNVSQVKKIFIVPFVSYIEPIIQSLTYEIECRVLQKYNIYDSKYICVMNQFWQHKNHIVILEAMKIFFQKNPGSNLKFVFTGKLEDYRSPEYIEKIKKLFEEEFIMQHSILLGFIGRDEQIAIMKNAEYVIQPSLFEGWGTVVEDAKVLDKTILLSDIPVHREQMNNKCILFDPYNAQQLADLIKQENSKEHHDDIEAGIADMKARAKEYSKGFQELLEV